MIDLDTSGLKCPLPVLKAKKALRDMDAGDLLRVVSTDPSSMTDFPDYCGNAGHHLVEAAEADGKYRFVICKDGQPA